MPVCAAAIASLALLAGAQGADSPATLSLPEARRAPDLSLRRVAELLGAQGALGARLDAREGAPPACLADFCQPVVSVPGFEPRYQRASRTDLFLVALQRARIEPVASLAWALASTGLRLDWTPPSFDGNANAHGWGSALLRLRFRIDATNRPVFPKRPDARWGLGQRPARRSST